MIGYARFHRSLIGHPAFRNDSEAMAFAYLVLRASWKPTRVRYKGKALSLNRGQLAMSVRDLADAMDRDKGWVERLLKRLKSETMVETLSETGVMVITICNYDKYQASNDDAETPGKTPDETDARQTQDTEQEDKEYKKEEVEEAVATQLCRSPAQPIAEAVSLWNENAASAGWPTIAKQTPARQAALRARLKEDGIDGWAAGIARARASPFLCGSPPPSWFTFDFIVKPGNFAKLIEGNYDGNGRSVSGQSAPGRGSVDGRLAAFREMSSSRSPNYHG